MNDSVLLTFDVDWAPDFMIDAIARVLEERDVKATWLVTHASPAVDRLREHPELFELGIHPNFLPASSHGGTVDEVLATCMRLVPEANSMRSHALVQSSPLLARVVETTPIRCDSSLMLADQEGLEPVGYPHSGGPLVRVPYFWEDDVEMMRPAPRWALADYPPGPGLRVFDFHPVHVFLNGPDLGPYRALTASGPLPEVFQDVASGLVANGPGPGTLFLEIVEQLASGGSQTLWEVATAYRKSAIT